MVPSRGGTYSGTDNRGTEHSTFAEPHGSTDAKPHGSAFAEPHGSTFAEPHGSTFAEPHGSTFAEPYGSTFAEPYGSIDQRLSKKNKIQGARMVETASWVQESLLYIQSNHQAFKVSRGESVLVVTAVVKR